MKTKLFISSLASTFLVLMLCAAPIRSYAQYYSSASIHPTSSDISYDLDLRAVVDLFADSRSIEDFEWRLNDPYYAISNLDMNRDGRIDYLRVVEMYERNLHLVVIQSVLGQNIFQDVATITVEKANRTNYIQIIGSPYIYGVNYIIEPVFYRTPVIYSWLWKPRYVVWHSPYYWGYYPAKYYPRNIIRTNVYVTNIYNTYYSRSNNRYNYTTTRRSSQTVSRMQTSISRDDYARANPGQSFERRNASNNTSIRNARDMQLNTTNRESGATRASQQPARSTQERTTTPATRQTVPASSGSTATRSTTTNRTGTQPATTATQSRKPAATSTSTSATRSSSATQTRSTNTNNTNTSRSTTTTTRSSSSGSSTRSR